MFHGVIHKITLAQLFLRHGVDLLTYIFVDDSMGSLVHSLVFT